MSPVLLAVTLVAAGCSSTRDPDTDSGSGSASGAAATPCGSQLTPDPAAAVKVPAGFAVVRDWTAIEAITQGKTQALRGAVPGTPADIVAVRDAAFAMISGAGYRKVGGDEEPGTEADGDFSGPRSGNINVRTLCQGHLVVTYTFEN